jgi:hypothetical protein
MTVCRLRSFIPLTPFKGRTSRDLKDLKDNANVVGGGALSNFHSSQYLSLNNNLNASTSSIQGLDLRG